MKFARNSMPDPPEVARPSAVDEPASNLVTVRQIGGGWACVSFDVAGLSDHQIAEARIAFRAVSGDGDDPDGLGGVMCDVVRLRAVSRLSDVLHYILDPRRGPLTLSRM
jgi:hypothetical protein